jgi:V/A-type H+-transporting ATPase subunit D
MAKIKLSKNELKRQKDGLKRFLRYLPTLQLKKQQLQMELRRIEYEVERRALKQAQKRENLREWVAVFADGFDIASLVTAARVETGTANIAGIDIPVFNQVRFTENPSDLFLSPLWVDRGLEMLKDLYSLEAELAVFRRQEELIGLELRVTSQRINLFEKVKIPEARENIRVIQIFLGDQQVAAVVRGKISKNKIVRSQEA